MSTQGRYSPPAVNPTPPPTVTETIQPLAEPTAAVADRRRGLARVLILAGLAILLLWVGLKTWRILSPALSLLALRSDAEALMSGGMSGLDPDAAEALARSAQTDIRALRNELAFLETIAPIVSWIPRIGPTVEAAPYLLEMADAGSEAGLVALTSLRPALAVMQREDFSATRLGELLPVLASAAPQLATADVALQRYEAARTQLAANVVEGELPWRVRQLLDSLDSWMPLLRGGMRLAPALPELLGQDGPRRYLIMAQNEDEMRPTGGFLTGAGMLTVDNGTIIDLQFQDANQVDNWRTKPYNFPPQPLYDFMLLEMFLFRDANFWPDFPTSAQAAMDLYSYGQDAPALDGAIAVDQELLRRMVEATGPVPVPGADVTISSDNVLQMLREARDIQEGQAVNEWVHDRKAFLAGFASAILGKLSAGGDTLNLARLARNMAAAAEDRHLSIYVRDPDTARALSDLGWDGRLPSAPPGDFLMVVDMNVGYNKSNLLIERSIDYEVSLADLATPSATLNVRYRHTGTNSDKNCFQGVKEEFEAASGYMSLADQCYWNYLRAYVPAGSQLTDSSRHIVPGDTLFSGVTWESNAQALEEFSGLTTFANFMLVARGAETSARFQYALPPGVLLTDNGAFEYQLRLTKQPGMRMEPVRVAVTLPAGARLESALPAPSSIEGERIVFEIEHEYNEVISLRFR